MIHSIEMINNSTLLSGIKLGYEIYDTCTEVTVAMAAALRFLSKFNSSGEIMEFKCDYSSYMPRVKAVIGAGYSEITMAVSRMLNLQLMPQVGFVLSLVGFDHIPYYEGIRVTQETSWGVDLTLTFSFFS